MDRQEAKKLYFQLRSDGYSHDEAKSELKLAMSGSRSEDPTAQYWDKLITQESGGDQRAISPAGAVGVAQVMKGTGPEAAELAGREWDERAWREDPEYNAAIGRAYLRKQMKDFGDDRLGLAAYNAGPGRVRQHIKSGRPLPGETQKYVPAIAGSEQKMNREQARAYAQKRLSEGADMAAVKAELQSMLGAGQQQARQQAAPPVAAPQQPAPVPTPRVAPQPQQQAPQPQGRPNDIDELAQGWLEESWPEMSRDPGSRAIHGFARGTADVVRGARQLWNELGDDEEDKSMAQYLRRRQDVANQFEERINPKGSGLQLQDIAKISPAIMAYGQLKGPGMVAGALQGAAAPLGKGESRLDNAVMGGALGAVGDVASAGVRTAKMLRDRYKNTIGAREAIDDFSERVLGEGRGSNNIPAYERVGGAVKDKLQELEDDFAQQYKAVEGNKNLPTIALLPPSKAGREFSMSDEVAGVLTPKTQKLLRRLDEAGNGESAIVDEAGQPIQSVVKVTFEDMRNAIREIRATARKLPRDDISRNQLKRAEQALQDDILNWAMNKGPEARKAYETAKEIDSAYRRQVVPFYSKKTPVGKYVASDVMDEKAFNSQFMGDDTGMALKDLKSRVPGSEKDLRQLYGSKLREARGDVMTIRKLESGTTAEELLTKKEREYLGQVAKEIYKEGGPAQHSSVMPTGLMRLMEKTTFSQDLQRMIGGLRRYGMEKPDSALGKNSQALIRYLRALGTQQAVEE